MSGQKKAVGGRGGCGRERTLCAWGCEWECEWDEWEKEREECGCGGKRGVGGGGGAGADSKDHWEDMAGATEAEPAACDLGSKSIPSGLCAVAEMRCGTSVVG